MFLWGPLSLSGPPNSLCSSGAPEKTAQSLLFPTARPSSTGAKVVFYKLVRQRSDHCREHLRDREESLGKTGKSLCLTTVRLIPSGHSLTGLSLEKPRKIYPKPFVHLGLRLRKMFTVVVS